MRRWFYSLGRLSLLSSVSAPPDPPPPPPSSPSSPTSANGSSSLPGEGCLLARLLRSPPPLDCRVSCEVCKEGRFLVRISGKDSRGIVHAVVSVLSDLQFDIERATVGTDERGEVEDEFVCLPSKRRSPVEASDLRDLIQSRLSLLSTLSSDASSLDGVLLKSRICATPGSEIWSGQWDGTPVAVKVVKEDAALVREELASLRQIRHPHVCVVYGVCSFSAGRMPGIVMELCVSNLHSRLHEKERRRPLPSPLKLRWLTELASALSHIHQNDIVHRDVKPQNVLLDQSGRVRLSDFGLARLTSGRRHLTGETGTYRYMAPEVIKSEEYGSACDVFSFGMTAWEVVFETYPFHTLTPIQTAFAIAEGRRPTAVDKDSTSRKRRAAGRLSSLASTLLPLCWEQDPLLRCSSRHVKEVLFRLRL